MSLRRDAILREMGLAPVWRLRGRQAQPEPEPVQCSRLHPHRLPGLHRVESDRICVTGRVTCPNPFRPGLIPMSAMG
jgi:hypothetical protein